MIRTASWTSLRGGVVGRCTRGEVPRRAQVTVIGKVAKTDAAADCGTSTLQVETTVAVTTRGAEADCACATGDAPARIAAASTARTITVPFYRRQGFAREGPATMRHLVTGLSVFLAAVVLAAPASAQQPSQAPAPATQAGTSAATSSPWLVVPVFSSNPKLGTAIGGLGAYLHTFDPDSRVSLFGVTYQYTTTHSQIGAAFARTSFGADHHRLTVVAPFGHIKNDYDDYLGTGQPLKTDDDFRAVAARYLFRATGDWFIGAQGNAANYQVLGAEPEDELVLETLGLRGVKSAALGAVVMHDS